MNDSNATSKFLQKHSDFGLKTLSKFLPIAIVIVLANGLVFVLFYRCRRLRTSSNYVLLSLAICDFSIGAIAIPYFIVHNFGISPPQMNYGVYASHTLLAISGAYHILFITGLKYMATVSPLKHHLVTKSLVLKIVFGIWITSTVFAIIPVVLPNAEVSARWEVIHTAVCLVAVFLFPYIFMIYAYIAMFSAITKRQRPSLIKNKNSREQKKKKSDRKCILVFATMAIIFACCWFSYFMVMLLFQIGLKDLLSVIEAVMVIRYITSLANPLLYTFFKRDFWSAFQNLLQNKEKVSSTSQKSQTGSLSLTSRLRSRSSVNSRRLTTLEGEGQEPRMIPNRNVTFGEETFLTSRV